MHEKEADGNARSAPGRRPGSATELYDSFAADYDEKFVAPSLRAAYDQLAWEQVEALLPGSPATILDVGCGTGRWVSRCQGLGHIVIGIEPSAGMREVLQRKFSGAPFTLIDGPAETALVSDRSVDVVLAMGSLQYTTDPDAMVRRMTQWLKPGGLLCVHVDGLVALTLELMRLGRLDEAVTRLNDGHGIFTYEGKRASLHLYNAARLSASLGAAGLAGVETRGLLVSPSAFGREQCEASAVCDYETFLKNERRLMRNSGMTDAGKHIMAWGKASE